MKTNKSKRIICIVLVVIMVLGLFISVLPVAFAEENAISDQLSILEEQKKQKQAEREAAQSKLQALKAEQDEVMEEKLALEQRNEAAAAEIVLIEREIDVYNQMIAAKGREVTAAQKKEDEQLEKYRTRIRAMEENGNYNILALILNAQSFSELLASMDDYGDVMDSDKTLFDQYQAAREALEDVKAEYEEYKADCEDKMNVLLQEQAELKAQIQESEDRLAELAEEIKEAEEAERKAAEQLSAASANIEAFLNLYYQQKQEAQASGESTYTDASGVTYDYSTQGSDSGYIWPFPASHSVSSGYKTRWGRQHTGVDIDGFNNEGAAIVAARAGTVILAGWNGGYGNCVMIDHGDAVTLYGHMNSISVSVGQAVNQGTTVGGCGMTGSATGLHLHFEIRIGGSTVDPLPYLPGGWVGESGWDAAS